MNAVDFCYWLQGHFELSEDTTLSEGQIKMIQNHLNLVFEFMNNPAYVEVSPYNLYIENQQHSDALFGQDDDGQKYRC